MSGPKCTPKDAQASTPRAHDREEAQRRFEDASRAYYLLAHSGCSPLRQERAGAAMDRWAARLA